MKSELSIFQRPSESHGFSDDLLCSEGSRILDGDGAESSTDLELQIDIEESIAKLVEDERAYVPGLDYPARFQSQPPLDGPARRESIAWIFKVHAIKKFHPITAYLSVNYIDRFLYSRRLPETNGWPLQLLSVACLSLAAKMEETQVTLLSDLQVEDAKFIFKARVVQRMELLVLTTLDWRLRCITPFHFLFFFACKVDPKGTWTAVLVSRARQIILAAFQRLVSWTTAVVCSAAAILHSAKEIPYLSPVSLGDVVTWCDGLNKDRIVSCYSLMQQHQDLVVESSPPNVLPQLIVTTHGGVISDSSFSSSSLSPLHKRREPFSPPPLPSSSSN